MSRDVILACCLDNALLDHVQAELNDTCHDVSKGEETAVSLETQPLACLVLHSTRYTDFRESSVLGQRDIEIEIDIEIEREKEERKKKRKR